uniref:3'(2'),5'-bisphosphate nucleotidase 1 n=1 Tax=Aceria tosichella TaxID=561515 RepID=A0A6G1SFP9_9ACAR
MEQPSVMLRLLSSVVSVAGRAGGEVRRVTKSGMLGVVDKGVQDYQTEADRVAQRMIVASLNKKFPKCTIVGEEDLAEDKEADTNLLVDTQDEDVLNKTSLPSQYKDVKEEDITIWVDPLDGTAEFVSGGLLEHVTILVGISVGQKSVAGVIHQPFHGYKIGVDPASLPGRTMWGVVGLGCFGVEPKSLPNDKLVVTTTASHGNVDIEETLAGLKPDNVLKVGGAGHKVLLVIEGKAHSYVFPSNGCKRWDTSAPEALLESAGGKLTTIFGDHIEYSYRANGDYKNYLGIVASANAEIHSRILANIPEAVKERLRAAQPLQ